MYKEYPYLLDGYYQSMNSQLTKKEFLKKIDELVVNHQYVKITLLDVNENPIKDITGEITGGSLNVSGDSTARKTSSLTCSLTTDIEALSAADYSLEPIEQLKQYFSIDKKIFLEIGIRNDIDEKPWTADEYPILWFPQGIFFITDFSISSAANSPISLSIGLKDKMCKLNGFSGGKFPSITRLDTYYDYGEANAVAEEMSKKSLVKGAQDDHVMNTKIAANGTKTSDISWTKTGWKSDIEDYLFLENKSGTAVAKFNVNSNKYLQFEYSTSGDNRSLISYELKRGTEVIKDYNNTSYSGQGEYKLSEYEDLTYKREVLYLDTGSYTLTFKYVFNSNETDDETSEDDETYKAYAAIHMLNSDLDGGMTFIQQHNGKNPIYNIISEIVHHFGEEDLSKVIVEDVPVYAKTLIKWDPTNSDYSGQDLYMISNIRNNDPILEIGNRIVDVANDTNTNIPGTNFGKRYNILPDEGLSEDEKQPDYASDNLMLVTAKDMRKIEMYKWALSILGSPKNMFIANAANKSVIEDLNDEYTEYVYAGHATIDNYLNYISNAGTFGSKAISYSSFGGIKYNVDINDTYIKWTSSLSSILTDLDHTGKTCYFDKNGYLFSISNSDNAIYFYKFKDEDYSLYGEYSVERYQPNDDIGYTQSYLYYDGELTAAAGDSVTSILDKIVEYLGGNYEFYYDTFGSFHFREKRNYLQKSFSTAMIKDTETANNFLSDTGIYYLTDTYQGENVYTFSDKNNITSISNNPNYSNIKNDYIVHNKAGDDMVFYHIAIDERPEINKNGYDNVLVYQDPTAGAIPGVRSEQYQLAFPIFIDSPKGPQGSGSANIYGYINPDDEVKIKLNEVNWNKDYSKTINISAAPKEEKDEEKEQDKDTPTEEENGDDDALFTYEDESEFFFHLTFLNLLFATGGDSKKNYCSDKSITSKQIGACLYYLYNRTDNANRFYYLQHSTSTKTIYTNKGKKNEKKYNIYKADLAYKHKLGLSYTKRYIDFTGFENAQYAEIFNSSSYRFKDFESSYLALGKNNYQRLLKVSQLIRSIIYDNYLYDSKESGTWTSNGISAEGSFIDLYLDCMGGLSSLYSCAEESYNKKSNGKHNSTDKYYVNNFKKYVTGYMGGTNPKLNYGAVKSLDKFKEQYRKQLKKENKKRKAAGKKPYSKKKINELVEAEANRVLKAYGYPRFKDKRTKGYSSVINALYRTLKDLYALTKGKKATNAVKLGKYYYSNKSATDRTANKKLLLQLLHCFWDQCPDIKKNDKNKNVKFKNYMNKNSKTAYKFLVNFFNKNMDTLSQTITFIRYKEKTDIISTASDVIAKAREHKGCCEVPAGSNKVKDVSSHGGGYIANGYAWCAAFVRHVFKECGMLNKITYSGVGYSNLHCFYYQYGPNFRKKSSGYKPQPGDLVLFDWGGDGYSDHIGIVIKDNGSTLRTIEGNTGGGKVTEYSNRPKTNVLGYVENNLVKKTTNINKSSYTTVTYTLFSLFRKIFFYELNNIEYKDKKSNRCNFLKQKMRTYYEILYNKKFCENMKNIYANCANSGENAKEKKVSSVSQTPTTDTPSDIAINTKSEKAETPLFSINLKYLSGKTWQEWVSSSYNTTPKVSTVSTLGTLTGKYLIITANGVTYWLGNDLAQAISAESDISPNGKYNWYNLAEVTPKEEAVKTSGIGAPNVEYTTYNCIYKGIETAKFWYYDTVSSSWTELKDWVCYYNADENKRYYNVDFENTSIDTYSGIITPKYLPNLQFMKTNAVNNKDTNELVYTYKSNHPSMRINSDWYKNTSLNSKSPLKLDNCEYNINNDDNRTNLSKYIAKEWRTEIILQGLLSYEQNSIAASYYYPELKANWPTTYNLKNQCFYGQEEENDLYHTSLTNGNYFLDLIEPNETQMGNLSVSNIGRRQMVTTSDSVNCLFKPEPHDYYFINSAALDYFEQRDRIHNEGGVWITVSPELWEKCFFVGSTKVDAYNLIRSQMTAGTNYQNTISISSIPVLYLDPNIRISVEDSSTNTYGDYIINSFSINFSGTPSMTTNATKAIVQY